MTSADRREDEQNHANGEERVQVLLERLPVPEALNESLGIAAI